METPILTLNQRVNLLERLLSSIDHRRAEVLQVIDFQMSIASSQYQRQQTTDTIYKETMHHLHRKRRFIQQEYENRHQQLLQELEKLHAVSLQQN